MSNYENGKIYMLYNTSAPIHKVYYGSTVETLKERLDIHKSKSNRCTSKSIIDSGTYAIKLIENFPCNNEYELEDREAEYIISNWDSCVNKNIPGAQRRAGGEKEYQKKYNVENKDQIKEYNKQYREKNKHELNAKKRQKVTCNLCGSTCTRNGIAKHKKTKKCQSFVQSEVQSVLDDLISQIEHNI